MRILILAPDQHTKYNFGHQLFRDEIARQHEVDSFGHWPKKNPPHDTHIPNLIKDRKPYDAILVEGPKYAGHLTGIAEIPAVRFSLFNDYVPPYIEMYDKFMEKNKLNVVFANCLYSLRHIRKMQRRGTISKGVDAHWLPFSVDINYFQKSRGFRFIKDVDAMAVYSDIPWCYKNRRTVQREIQTWGIKTVVGGTSPGQRIWHKDYVSLINRSKIFVTSNNIYKVMSMKYTEAMACGTFVLADAPEGFTEQGFVDGEHLVLYDGIQDLKEKVFYYLDHDHEGERERIAESGMKFVQSRHTNRLRVKYLSHVIESNL